jgi:hypothetical protein
MSTPSSYKIQVLYNEVPAFIKTRLIDTPFRFATYEDAMTLGEDMFNGVQFRIVGSSDRPHWQSTPIEQSQSKGIKDKGWYNIYGVSPVGFKQPTEAAARPQLAQTVEVLKRLNPQPVTGGVFPRELRNPDPVTQKKQAPAAQKKKTKQQVV